ncbi:MAG: ABC transporter permease [Elusimicrobia bacterium]|nr:ABC transporter permease [Elusimicrobiota bacterium]
MLAGTLEILGQKLLLLAEILGRTALLVRSTFFWFLKSSLEVRQSFIQCLKIGVQSLPVTAMTSFFTGMVLALQSGMTSRDLFNEPIYVGTVVAFSMVKELGPVLTAIVVAGRAGAAIAAEIGTMRVTEQIDALNTLGTNPIRYLVIPRYIGCFFMLPLLTVFSNFSGVLGGFVVSVVRLNIPSTVYWDDIFTFMENEQFFHGFLKSFVFALTIATVSCYKGLNTRGGAEGVGRSTTSAVVVSMVSILILDYFLTAILVAFGIS